MTFCMRLKFPSSLGGGGGGLEVDFDFSDFLFFPVQDTYVPFISFPLFYGRVSELHVNEKMQLFLLNFSSQ